MQTETVDVAIVGGGAAGLMCAGIAAQRGRAVVLLEHTAAIGAKILISGGGRCNFTNLDVRPDRFLSDNPHFAKSALARYTQHDFIALVQRHGIPFYEKTLGQLFCDGVGAARRIVDLLAKEAAGATVRTGVSITGIAQNDGGFTISFSGGAIQATSLVIASGGLSIPKLGATDVAFRIAKQFGVPIVAPRPALTPLTFSAADRAWMSALAGVSTEADVRFEKTRFREGLLFTHRGLSGPSILQISSYRRPGAPIHVDFSPGDDLGVRLLSAKRTTPRVRLTTVLREMAPARLVDALLAHAQLRGDALADAPLADIRDADLQRIGAGWNALALHPDGDEGYAKAEVTAGGVDTRALSSQTMAVRAVPNLYFIGEAVDVTGWLGGYNFQWAWSSGWAAGQAV